MFYAKVMIKLPRTWENIALHAFAIGNLLDTSFKPCQDGIVVGVNVV